MEYELIPPPRPLVNYVRFGWRLKKQSDNTHPEAFRVVPDGCPGMLVAQHGEMHLYGKKLPQIILYGQTAQSTQIALSGKPTLLGICFYPDTLNALFGLKAFEFTETCIDVGEVPGTPDTTLFERLEQPLLSNPFDVLFGYISTHLQRNDRTTDPVIAQALHEIILSNGNVMLKNLQGRLRLSERSLERRFKESIGIPPKLFAKICRFQAALNQLKNGSFDKLSDVAYESGYADHSHFTRTFKAFSGTLPEQYYRTEKVLFQHFPQLTIG